MLTASGLLLSAAVLSWGPSSRAGERRPATGEEQRPDPSSQEQLGSLAYLGGLPPEVAEQEDRIQVMDWMLWSADILVVTVLQEVTERNHRQITQARIDSVLAGDRRPGQIIWFQPFGRAIEDDLWDRFSSGVQMGGTYVVGLCRDPGGSDLRPSGLLGPAGRDSVHVRYFRHAHSWAEFRSMMASGREIGTLPYLVSHSDACVLGRVEDPRSPLKPGARVSRPYRILTNCRLVVESVYGDRLGRLSPPPKAGEQGSPAMQQVNKIRACKTSASLL